METKPCFNGEVFQLFSPVENYPPVYFPHMSARKLDFSKGHSRSASHGGVGNIISPSYAGRPSALKKGHTRALSHGHILDSNELLLTRSHARTSSRTDFILPIGHRESEASVFEKYRAGGGGGGHSRQASRTDSVYTLQNQNPPPLWKKYFCFFTAKKRPKEEPRLKTIVPNHILPPQASTSKRGFRASKNGGGSCSNNKICTTKYTLLSFLPKNLLEQFHRFANLYFIFIVLLNWFPYINAFGKEIAVLPVLFVLGVTAMKDLFEDRRRHASDKRINNSISQVYSSEENSYKNVLWKDVRPGDLVRITNNNVIPADILVLNCSDANGLCFIDTCNLDGESNLKQRQVPLYFAHKHRSFSPSLFRSSVEVEPPTTKIYRFNGAIVHPTDVRIPVGTENLLLRECVLKNTDFVEGIVVYAGHETKAMLNNNGPRYKRSFLEKQVNTDIMWCVVILLVLCCTGAIGNTIWRASFPIAPAHIPFLPYDEVSGLYKLFVVGTFVIILQVMIPLSLYVTIELVKLLQVYHIHNNAKLYDPITDKRVECRALNITEELGQVQYIFSDKTGTLTENKMLFRRCTIAGVDYNHPSCPPPTMAVQSASSSSSANQSAVSDETSLNRRLADLNNINAYSPEDTSNRFINNNQSSVAVSSYNQTKYVQDFMLVLSLCNTVVISVHSPQNNLDTSSPDLDRSPSNFLAPQGSATTAGGGDSSANEEYDLLKRPSPSSDIQNNDDSFPSFLENRESFDNADTSFAARDSWTAFKYSRRWLLRRNNLLFRHFGPSDASTSGRPPTQSRSAPAEISLSSSGCDSNNFGSSPDTTSTTIGGNNDTLISINPSPSNNNNNNPAIVYKNNSTLIDSSSESSPPRFFSIQQKICTLDIFNASTLRSRWFNKRNMFFSQKLRNSANSGDKNNAAVSTSGGKARLLDLEHIVKPVYEAESPDELALVETAYAYDYRLISRLPGSATIIMPGNHVLEFDILKLLPFDSVRKCMSVIVRHPITKEIIVLCKGADSTILPLIARNTNNNNNNNYETQQITNRTRQHLNMYASQGLRVLVMAKRILTEKEYDEWSKKYREAEMCFGDRERKLQKCYAEIEKNFELLGATGIEDRLQEGVPETISALRAAGIVVWVLTGDKKETAINVAYSTHLFNPQMEIIKISARSKDSAQNSILYHLKEIENNGSGLYDSKNVVNNNKRVLDSSVFASWWSVLQRQKTKLVRLMMNNDGPASSSSGTVTAGGNNSGIVKQRALVIDGKTLTFILDRRSDLQEPFLRLTRYCTSVLCCRATPLQKAYIVKIVKDKLHMRTLAIGDGANDVSMIQAADVGIGISGQEGMQAVMASDFSMPKFRFLERFLLVHGHWCYDRLANMIIYFFYKNAIFVFVIFWYQLYCGFSGAVMIDEMYLMLYNLFFTSLPPLIIGVYDQDGPEELLMSNPALYAKGRLGLAYRQPYAFWLSILDALYQSLIIFFFSYTAYNFSEIGIWEFGMTIVTSCMVTMLLQGCLSTRSWSIMLVISSVISLGSFFLFTLFYNAVCLQCYGLISNGWVLDTTLNTATYWLIVIISTTCALLPRIIFSAIKASLMPDDISQMLAESRQVSQRKENFLVSWSRCASSSLYKTRESKIAKQQGKSPTLTSVE